MGKVESAPKAPESESRKRLFRAIRIRYVVALALIATLITASFGILQITIQQQDGAATTVNIAGRQRMLSQRIAFLSQSLAVSTVPSDKAYLRKEIHATAELMEKSLTALIVGSKELGIPHASSVRIKDLYFAPPHYVSKRVTEFIKNARAFADTPNEELTVASVHLHNLLTQARGPLLNSLDTVSRQYEREGEQAVDQLAKLENVFWLLALMLLGLELVLIFNPLLRMVKRQLAEADISADALRQSDDRKNAVINSALEAILEVDSKGKIIKANPATERIFRIRGSAIGGAIGEYLALPTEQLPQHALRTVLGRRVDLLARRQDGNHFPVEAFVSEITEQGDPFFILFVRDLSTRMEAERLTLENERIRAKDIAKSEFVSKMSHELKTPLNAIIGLSEVIREDCKEGDVAQIAEINAHILESAEHLLALVNDILDISRIEAGHLDLNYSPVDLGRLIDSVSKTILPLAESNANRLEVRILNDLGQIRTDSKRIKQILLNLLGNACKFTSDGHIGLGVERTDGSTIVFTITDTGIGMSEAQIKDLFKEFHQVDKAVSEKYGGTGLGLAISKRLCTMMGGEIAVTSEHGKGSTFTVTLPIEP